MKLEEFNNLEKSGTAKIFAQIETLYKEYNIAIIEHTDDRLSFSLLDNENYYLIKDELNDIANGINANLGGEFEFEITIEDDEDNAYIAISLDKTLDSEVPSNEVVETDDTVETKEEI